MTSISSYCLSPRSDISNLQNHSRVSSIEPRLHLICKFSPASPGYPWARLVHSLHPDSRAKLACHSKQLAPTTETDLAAHSVAQSSRAHFPAGSKFVTFRSACQGCYFYPLWELALFDFRRQLIYQTILFAKGVLVVFRLLSDDPLTFTYRNHYFFVPLWELALFDFRRQLIYQTILFCKRHSGSLKTFTKDCHRSIIQYLLYVLAFHFRT